VSKPKTFKVWVDGSATIGGYIKVSHPSVTTEAEAKKHVNDNGVEDNEVDWEIMEVNMRLIDGEEV